MDCLFLSLLFISRMSIFSLTIMAADKKRKINEETMKKKYRAAEKPSFGHPFLRRGSMFSSFSLIRVSVEESCPASRSFFFILLAGQDISSTKHFSFGRMVFFY